MTSLAPLLQGFFTTRLISQRRSSPHTIASYRDTFRLLLTFAWQHKGIEPSQLDLDHLDADLITAFLHHLQTARGNSTQTRNARLAAIHSMFRYAALQAPEHAATIQQVLAIPGQSARHPLMCFLTSDESEAMLGACDQSTWTGRRDHTLLLLALQTGLRLSELVRITRGDVVLSAGAHVHVTGKGRKERCTPLNAPTVAAVRRWLSERDGTPQDPLFCTRHGSSLSPDAVQALTAKYHRLAARDCPSMAAKNVTPHTLRHSCAMNLLHAGVDIATLALWLGHEDPKTTMIYIHADMALKERALARTTPPDVPIGRYQPSDSLLAYLQSL